MPANLLALSYPVDFPLIPKRWEFLGKLGLIAVSLAKIKLQ